MSYRVSVGTGYLPIRPVARKEGYGSIAHEAKPKSVACVRKENT